MTDPGGKSPRETMIDLLTYEDLNADMQIVAEAAGMDIVRALMRTCPGARYYVPQPERMLRVLERFIMETYPVATSVSDKQTKVLAVQLGISYEQVQNAIRSIAERQITRAKKAATANSISAKSSS